MNHSRFLLDLRYFFLKRYFFSRIDDRSAKLLRILFKPKNLIGIQTNSKLNDPINNSNFFLNGREQNINLRQIALRYGGNYKKIIIKCRKLVLVDSQKILPFLLNSSLKDVNINNKLIIQEICLLNSLKIILTKYGINSAIVFRLIVLRGMLTMEKISQIILISRKKINSCLFKLLKENWIQNQEN